MFVVFEERALDEKHPTINCDGAALVSLALRRLGPRLIRLLIDP